MTTTITSDDARLLQLVRLKGRLLPAAAAALCGAEAAIILNRLAAEGMVIFGAAGARLTAEGKIALAAGLRLERTAVDRPRVAALYGEFDAHNSALKDVVSAWQMRPDGAINDHSEAEYDDSVIRRLQAAHCDATDVLDRLGDAVPRLTWYPGRLAAALERVAAGEHKYLASPVEDSYHQVWFELHEDLLGLLELSREDEARAGRA